MASPAIIPNPPSTSNPLLETNNLIERFLEDVDRRGLVGEQANAVPSYCVLSVLVWQVRLT